MKVRWFSWSRFAAVLIKEFIQMRRDKVTLAMIIGIPLIQLVLFGYAINANPRHLPTVIVSGDHSQFTREFVRGLKNSRYFKIVAQVKNLQLADRLMARGETLFIVAFPANFTKNLVRGLRPQILIQADATDPIATANAVNAVRVLALTVFNRLLKGPLHRLQINAQPRGFSGNAQFATFSEGPVDLVVHAKYNPENITQYSIVPGLLGVVLTMTMVIVTSLAITREYERGTMENLLSTPARPVEVMLGKLIPFVIVGYIQVSLIILAAFYLFAIPVRGSLWLLLIASLPFIMANLSVGLTFSSISRNQLQAVQMTFFFFLPSILLSGFMFPFDGMPTWARWLGQGLPLTHFIRIVRGILLKGNHWSDIWVNIWPILLFMVVALFIGINRYRQTLD